MGNTHPRKMVLLSMIIIAASLVGCTRSASTQPATTATEGLSIEEINQRATMDAVRATLLAQTSQPQDTEAPTSTPTPTLSVPTLSPTPTGPTPTAVVVFNTATPGPGEDQTYIVQSGDTVYSIARAYGVTPEDIIARNNLQYPYYLDVNQELFIPSGGTTSGPTNTPPAGARQHVVQQGEWIYSIARKYGVDPQVIIDANNLQFPFTIYPGDVLYIP
jgi:LysM repeat protein